MRKDHCSYTHNRLSVPSSCLKLYSMFPKYSKAELRDLCSSPLCAVKPDLPDFLDRSLRPAVSETRAESPVHSKQSKSTNAGSRRRRNSKERERVFDDQWTLVRKDHVSGNKSTTMHNQGAQKKTQNASRDTGNLRHSKQTVVKEPEPEWADEEIDVNTNFDFSGSILDRDKTKEGTATEETKFESVSDGMRTHSKFGFALQDISADPQLMGPPPGAISMAPPPGPLGIGHPQVMPYSMFPVPRDQFVVPNAEKSRFGFAAENSVPSPNFPMDHSRLGLAGASSNNGPSGQSATKVSLDDMFKMLQNVNIQDLPPMPTNNSSVLPQSIQNPQPSAAQPNLSRHHPSYLHSYLKMDAGRQNGTTTVPRSSGVSSVLSGDVSNLPPMPSARSIKDIEKKQLK